MSSGDSRPLWRRPALLESLAGPDVYMNVAADQTTRQLVVSGLGALAAEGLVAALHVRLPGYTGSITVTFSVGLLVMAGVHRILVRRWPRTALLILNGVLMPVDMAVALWGVGSTLSPTVAQGAVLTAIVTPILFPRFIGYVLLLASLGVYAPVLVFQHGNDAPVVRWTFLAIQAGLVAILVSWFSRLVSAMAAGEQQARAVAESALERLHVEDERRRSFLARMSHELRTPLNAVIGFSSLLREGRLGTLNERQAEYVDDITSSGRHLLDLVDDLLDLSSVEAGGIGLVRSSFPPSRVVADSVALCRQQAVDRGISLVIDAMPPLRDLHADERRTRQILLNLLANALAVTPPGGRVTVGAQQRGSQLVVSVSDTGPGIDPADQERIFAPYVQSHVTKKSSGTGLGLALARRFAEAQGGSLSVESVPGQGATFRLVLPVTSSDDAPRGAQDEPAVAARGVGIWDRGGALEQLVGVDPHQRFLARVGSVMLGGEALALLAFLILPHPRGTHDAALWPIVAAAAIGCVALFRRRARLTPETLVRAMYPATVVLGVATWLVGARAAAILSSAFVVLGILAFFGQTLRRALPLGLLISVSYAVALLLQRGGRAALIDWVVTMSLMVGGIALVRWLMQFVPTLAQAERVARARAELTNARLVAASRHKTEFLANMSHEVRTPLNAILGFSQVLGEEVFGPLNDRQADYVADILSSGRHLLALINDILDLAKAEAGRIELHRQPHRLVDVVDRAVAPHLTTAEQRRLRLEAHVVPVSSCIDVDADRLVQAVSCLLVNALAYTPAGGQVCVAADESPTDVTIAVSDTGPGIDPADHQRVFDEFEQAAGPGSGAGIGLALARRLVELQGGSLDLDSRPGHGSAFTIRLPSSMRAACSSGPEPDVGVGSRVRGGT